MLPQRAAAAVRRAAFGAHLRTKGRGPDARTFTTLGEDVAHRPARGRRSHQPNLGLRPRPLPGGHCSLSTGPPLLAHREIRIPQGTKLTRGLLELQDLQCTIGPPSTSVYAQRSRAFVRLRLQDTAYLDSNRPPLLCLTFPRS